MADVVIVGAGITGASAAYWLATAGLRPLVFDAHGVAAMGSGWSLGGVRQSGRHPAELPLARAAIALWPSLGERLDAELEYRRHGNLRLARTPEEVAAIRDLVATQQALGLDLTFLPTTADVRAVAPALSDRVLAASFCPTDGHANPARATQAFATAARRAGAEIREGVSVRRLTFEGRRVTGVETDGGTVRAGVVVVAAGIGSPALLQGMGLTLPLSVQVVTVLQTIALPPVLAQVLGVANADLAGRQEVDGRLRFTSGIGPWPGDPVRWQDTPLLPAEGEVARVRSLVTHVLPAMGDTPIERIWGGLIDLTPDALPVIDRPADVEGLVVAAGFSGHGFGIGPLVGALVADLAAGATPRLDLGAFRLDRFAVAASEQATLSLHG